MRLRLEAIRFEAAHTVSLELTDPKGSQLPAWTPGAHLELQLPSGRRRYYSLCGDPSDRRRYRVAVLRVTGGLGGSVELHDSVQVGSILEVSEPRNHFRLEEAAEYLFVAGGIGITPVLPMVEQVSRGNRSRWRLVYGGRNLDTMAFRDRIADVCAPDAVELVAEDTRGRPDLAAALSDLSEGAHVYGCGPPAMLAALAELCATRPGLVLHTERFEPAARPATAIEADQSFEVELARTGKVLEVRAETSVLDVVREVVPDVSFSCESGYCGTCETKMLGGRAEHRDSLLAEEERTANTSMMICVSRAAAGERLVLDL